jgi:holo-[acyl-carrier protein] synthase
LFSPRSKQCRTYRWAAKEALLKATGVRTDGHEILIRSETGDTPVVIVSPAALAQARANGVAHAHVSISHDAGTAIAFAVAERIQAEKDI